MTGWPAPSNPPPPATVVCLVPSRTGPGWWHNHVMDGASVVRFVKGRSKFGGATSSAPFDSAVVIYRPELTVPRMTTQLRPCDLEV